MDKGIKTPFATPVMPKHDYKERPTNGSDPKAKVNDTDENFGRVKPKDLPFNSLKID